MKTYLALPTMAVLVTSVLLTPALAVAASSVHETAAASIAENAAVAMPTWPIPNDLPPGPPPIPAMPPATATPPPADQAGCGSWYQQDMYGGRWINSSSWWEYKCLSESVGWGGPPCTAACNASCPECFYETQDWADYFVWNGSSAVFYGEAYSDALAYNNGWYSETNVWWDAATGQWYDIAKYLLQVSKQGNGAGEVVSSPAGIQCGPTCSAAFDVGTTVTLNATPAASSVFAGWSASPDQCPGTGPCVVAIDYTRSVTATFILKAYVLTVSKAGAGHGQVTSTPAGIACGTTCQGAFNWGTSVSLTAAPDASSAFVGWSGDCAGTGSCQVTVDQARSVTATFAPITYRPDAMIRLTPAMTWVGDNIYDGSANGQAVTINAVRGMTATFEVGAQNDGNVSDSLTVHGSGSGRGFTIHYFDGATDVTSAVVQGTYATANVPAGARLVIRATVTIANSVKPGTVGSFLVTIGSHGLLDAAKAVVTTVSR